MKILFRNITKYHISISVCNQPFWMNDCEWFSHDVCESVTRCVTSDGVSGCLISAGSRVPPSAGVIMTLTSCHDSPDSWLLTRDASHARCPAPTLSSLQACSPLLVSVAQSSWPLARGERGVTSSRHLAPQQMRSWVGPGPLLSAESSQPSYIQCRAEWALGFCSEVQCSIVLCRACRIGHVYFRVG